MSLTVDTTNISTDIPVDVSGTTSILATPKVTLFYRWVIRDYKCENIKSSPSFTVHVPSGQELAEIQPTNWHLSLEKSSTHNSYMSIHLKQEQLPYDNPEILINKCSFGIINPETNEVVQSAEAHVTKCPNGTSSVSPSSIYVQNYIIQNKIQAYLFNNTLTIEVNATLSCLDVATEEPYIRPPNNICKSLKNAYDQELFSDVTIECGDAEFKAHRVILASQSPVFRAMLETDMKEKRNEKIQISDIDPKVISDMLAFMYTGTAPNIKTLSKELLNAANKYELPHLMAICNHELVINIRMDNVIETLLLAGLHELKYLKKACWEFIKRDPRTVYESEECQDLKGKSDHFFSRFIIESLECILLDTYLQPQPSDCYRNPAKKRKTHSQQD